MVTLLFTFLVSQAQAQEKPVVFFRGSYNSDIKNVFPPDKFQYDDRESRRERWLRDGYLMPSERDALFRKLSIETKLSQLDQMDKDMLVMGARVYTPRELHKQYPMLTLGEVTKLKREVEKIK